LKEVASARGQSSDAPTNKKQPSISIPSIPRKSAVHNASVGKKTASQGSQQGQAPTGAANDPFAHETSAALDALVLSPVGDPLDFAASAGVSDFATFPEASSQFAQFPQSQQPSLLSVFEDTGAVLQPTVLSAPLAPQPMGVNTYGSFGDPFGSPPTASAMYQQPVYSSANQGSLTGLPPFSIASQHTGLASQSGMGFFPATQNADFSAPAPLNHAMGGVPHSSSFFPTQTLGSSVGGVNYAAQTSAANSLYAQPILAFYPASQPIAHTNVSSDISNNPNQPSNPFDL